MQVTKSLILRMLICLLIQALGLGIAVAQEAATSDTQAPAPQTTADPNIPVEYLELLLEPLTVGELEIEATAWRDLLKAKVSELSTSEIATRKKQNQIENVEDGNGQSSPSESNEPEASKETVEEEKQQVIDNMMDLRAQKAGLGERLSLVLDEWESKGGKPEEYRLYAKAVAGLNVDISDGAAAWAAVKGWLIAKEGGIMWLTRIGKFALVMVVFWFLANLVARVVNKALSLKDEKSDLLSRFIKKWVFRVVLCMGFLVGLSMLGVNVGALMALMGGGAFIIGFALQDTLSNFAAGLMLLIYRPFDEGDFVDVGGVSGKVDHVSIVRTSIRTPDNKVVLIPNKTVWGDTITNATASNERRVDLVFGISYDDDISKAEKILSRILENHELILKNPAPQISVNELADSAVNLVCRPWTKTANYWTVYWDLMREVKLEFDREGISFPYPQQDIYVRQVPQK